MSNMLSTGERSRKKLVKTKTGIFINTREAHTYGNMNRREEGKAAWAGLNWELQCMIKIMTCRQRLTADGSYKGLVRMMRRMLFQCPSELVEELQNYIMTWTDNGDVLTDAYACNGVRGGTQFYRDWC